MPWKATVICTVIGVCVLLALSSCLSSCGNSMPMEMQYKDDGFGVAIIKGESGRSPKPEDLARGFLKWQEKYSESGRQVFAVAIGGYNIDYLMVFYNPIIPRTKRGDWRRIK